jgi:putative ABC transport system substrate-binding protein
LTVGVPGDLERAFGAMTRERTDAALVLLDNFTIDHRDRIAGLAARQRVPAIYEGRTFVDAGGLLSYGPSIADMYRRAAGHVDRTLKGAPPGDLPVEQSTRFELRVNLKAARALGLTVPASVLLRADQVVE